MKTLAKRDLALTIILLCFLLYAGLYIYRTSFVIGGQRYFSLFDDAMVSMRYARNLAHGQGLVWNPGGERVEGYTNPLWVLYMSLFHLLPVAPAKVSLFIQVSGALFLLMDLIVVKKIADLLAPKSTFVGLAAVLLTAFYLPLNTWSLQGMEVGLGALIVTVSLWLAIRTLQAGQFSPWLYLLLGIGTLVRLDLAVPLVAIGSFLALFDAKNRRRHVLIGASALVFFVLAQTAFRLWYYGDVFPNTYYLKMTGYPLFFRITRGLYVTLDFAWRLDWLLALLPLTLYLYRREKGMLLLGWVFLLQVMYSIYVGGDAWEWWGGANRYVCIAMPAFMILTARGISRIATAILHGLNNRRPWLDRYGRYALVALALVSLTDFDPLYGRQSLGELLLLQRPLHVTDNIKRVQAALLVDQITTPQATVAVAWAGALPYFMNRYAIDLLGKNDRVIAHEPMRVPSGWMKLVGYYPGHLKWDYAYSIGQLQPDVVAQLWQSPEEAAPYLQSYRELTLGGLTFYLRQGSPNILWDKVPSSG